MKYIFAFGLIFLSVHALANLEHREDLGRTPAKKDLSVSRGCFREIDGLGCGHPSQGQEYFNSCLAEKQATLSSTCQTFFEKLYGKSRE